MMEVILQFTLVFLVAFEANGSGVMDNWMALGMQGADITRISLLGTTIPICQKIRGLTHGQEKLCMLYADHMVHVGNGAQKGISECQYQFRNNRWNCSTIDHSTVFGPILKIPSKEAAFANAIASAGVVHSISRGCKDGHLTSCGCSITKKPKELKKEWIWGGCGDNIHYGYKFAKNFIDIREREQNNDINGRVQGRSLMNVHNNEAGRRAVIKSMKVTCKCHGVSGSCSLVTCWQQLAPFRKIGDELFEKYNDALRVKITKNGRLRYKPNVKKRQNLAGDLVYLKKSPDYCAPNATYGIHGTRGRFCQNNSEHDNNCRSLCCHRGFDRTTVSYEERCNCKFHWCCRVECETCSVRKMVNKCQ